MKKIFTIIFIVIFLFSGGYDIRAAELVGTSLVSDANLKAYYQLESDGTDYKSSYSLTNTNSVTFGAAKYNNGAVWGAGDASRFLSTTTSCGIGATNVSFAFWAKITSEPGSGSAVYFYELRTSISSNYIDWRYYYENNGGTPRLVIWRNKPGVGAQQLNYNYTMGTSNFHHIVGTFDTSVQRLYVDGTEVASTTFSGVGTGGASSFTVNPYSSVNFIIDDLALFDKVLSASEVSTLYNAAAGGGSNPPNQDIIIFD